MATDQEMDLLKQISGQEGGLLRKQCTAEKMREIGELVKQGWVTIGRANDSRGSVFYYLTLEGEKQL